MHFLLLLIVTLSERSESMGNAFVVLYAAPVRRALPNSCRRGRLARAGRALLG
jgi:hypothetical protein